MDSISHLLLGASIGGALAPPAARGRAMWLGAALNTLPDLDYLVIGWGDAVTRFTAHRSFSHSLFVLPFVALLVWRFWLRWQLPPKAERQRWLGLIMACLFSHPLADALTVYGTQLVWPIATPPVMLASIYIIDPLYTLPLAIGVIAAILLRRRGSAAHRWLVAGLALSIAYQAWGLAAKFHVDTLARRQLAAAGQPEARVLTMPTPFNSLLWRVLVIDAEGYREGYYSLVAGDPEVRFGAPLRRDVPEIEALRGQSAELERLRWFTDGYYRTRLACDQGDCQLVFSDLRMGLEPDYVFSFALAARHHGGWWVYPEARAQRWPDLNRDPLSWVWRRIWDSSADPHPPG